MIITFKSIYYISGYSSVENGDTEEEKYSYEREVNDYYSEDFTSIEENEGTSDDDGLEENEEEGDFEEDTDFEFEEEEEEESDTEISTSSMLL